MQNHRVTENWEPYLLAIWFHFLIDFIQKLILLIWFEVDNWSLPSTLTACFSTLTVYLMLILKILPALMKDRPPLKLKRILLVYNIFQVVFSIILVLIVSCIFLYYIIKLKSNNYFTFSITFICIQWFGNYYH